MSRGYVPSQTERAKITRARSYLHDLMFNGGSEAAIARARADIDFRQAVIDARKISQSREWTDEGRHELAAIMLDPSHEIAGL